MNSSIVKAKEYKNDTNNRHRLTRNNDDDCDTSHPEIKATTYIPTVTGVAYDQNESNDPEEDEYIQALNSNPNPFPVPYPAPIRVVDRGVSATSGAVYTDGIQINATYPVGGDIENNVVVTAREAAPTAVPYLAANIIPQARRGFEFWNGNMVTPITLSTDLTERQIELLNNYRYGRIVRMVSFWSTFLTVLFNIFDPVFILVAIFPACGYFGIRYWMPKLLYIYLFYLIIDILLVVVTIVLYELDAIFIAIKILNFILDVFIIRIVYKLIFKGLVDFSDTDLLWLQNSSIIQEIDAHGCSI